MSALEAFGFLRIYLTCALVTALLWGALEIGNRASLPFGSWLRWARRLSLLGLALPLLGISFPRAKFHPAAQVFSGMHRKTHAGYVLLQSGGSSPVVLPKGIQLTHGLLVGVLAFLALGAVIAFARYCRSLFGLSRQLRELPGIRRLGQVRIIASRERVPYSALIFRRAYVVVPENLISDPTALRLAIRHELQHHRQRDTHTVHLVELARALFFWNPGYHAWANALARLQEFACDEALIGRQSVSPQAYGRCLFQVAEIASGSRRVHAGTTGMATGTSGSILKRRIEMILSMKSRKKGSLMMVGLAMGTALAVGGASLATGGVIQERKLTMEEARTYAENAARQTVIPIDLNDLVLARLNYFIGTAEGRDHVQRAFHRMPLYKRMIEALTKRYELPEELIAIPFFESAFDNSRISSMLAAGIWQFIPSTALTYDLVVNPREDDRFDPVKETHAAMKYYRDLWNRFGDWRLAIKSYNEGESRVEKLMAKLGTRDPWVLERAESMEDYLPGAIATLIILKNPELMR